MEEYGKESYIIQLVSIAGSLAITVVNALLSIVIKIFTK